MCTSCVVASIKHKLRSKWVMIRFTSKRSIGSTPGKDDITGDTLFQLSLLKTAGRFPIKNCGGDPWWWKLPWNRIFAIAKFLGFCSSLATFYLFLSQQVSLRIPLILILCLLGGRMHLLPFCLGVMIALVILRVFLRHDTIEKRISSPLVVNCILSPIFAAIQDHNGRRTLMHATLSCLARSSNVFIQWKSSDTFVPQFSRVTTEYVASDFIPKAVPSLLLCT